MDFKLGQVVIKKTGGNKMTIDSYEPGNKYGCLWFDDKKLHHEIFNGDDIITIVEYKKYLKLEEREDKISTLLNGN